MEKAVREAERATRDTQDKLETIRLDTELEVLTLHKEADAAIVTARVLEDAEAMQSVIEDGKSESEKGKIERTSEYVRSQISLKNRSPSSPLPVAPSLKVRSHDSFISWHPPVEDGSQLQLVSRENADIKQPSPPELFDPTKTETKAKVSRTNPTMNAHAPSYTTRHFPQSGTPTSNLGEPLAQYLVRRDLVTSGLYQFDDQPENYRAWYSFSSAANEVNLTATPTVGPHDQMAWKII